MHPLSNSDGSFVLNRPAKLFPLTRQLSYPVTQIIYRLPLGPNQITALSLLTGLIGAWCFAQGEWNWQLAGALWIVACYTLDNCDGEIARLKGLVSAWGAHFDDLVDWLVDSAFFAALGYGVWQTTDNSIWMWLGAAATLGATIDYCIDIYFNAQTRIRLATQAAEADATAEDVTKTLADRLMYVFHTLSRADFCFIILALTLFDVVWILLPFAAIGAQIYWIADIFRHLRRVKG